MVTANNIYNRFKDKGTMSESFIEKYIRAKKRNEASPRSCLFGKPGTSETDQFLEREEQKQRKKNKETMGKYKMPSKAEKSLILELCSTPSTVATTSVETTENVVTFQPTIITEDNPPPNDNLFSPIDKVELSTGGETITEGKVISGS